MLEGTVASDNVQAGSVATRHLIDLGHRQIAMLAGHLGLSPHRDRLEGFRKVIARETSADSGRIFDLRRRPD